MTPRRTRFGPYDGPQGHKGLGPVVGDPPRGPYPVPLPGLYERRAEDRGDALDAFYVHGGGLFFTKDSQGNDVGLEDGAQIVSALFVPRGKVATIKHITVAPLIGLSLLTPTTIGPAAFFASLGAWGQPFGWQRLDPEADWSWVIYIIDGRLEKRGQVSDLNDPRFGYLLPDVTVQRDLYDVAPGPLPTPEFGSSTIPRFGPATTTETETNVIVGEEKTAIVVCRWHNPVVALGGQSPIFGRVFAASFGALWGHYQSNRSSAAQKNVAAGQVG